MITAGRKESGNTPTCVGKTSSGVISLFLGEKHPHVRGEDGKILDENNLMAETPPRAWGRRKSPTHNFKISRNTPTCVGKTLLSYEKVFWRQKHPHVRGEDTLTNADLRSDLETPPRAWGRRKRLRPFAKERGNTPTCVGKTLKAYQLHGVDRKHPHVRGEDRLLGEQSFFELGNTPTCVGKTLRDY